MLALRAAARHPVPLRQRLPVPRLRATRSADGATHAWVEAFLPGLGWVGFDPTNNVIAGTRHIRVAIGRDYADVPPTKGVFRGRSANELAVAVQVSLADTAMLTRELMPVMTWTTPETDGQPDWDVDQSAAAAAAAESASGAVFVAAAVVRAAAGLLVLRRALTRGAAALDVRRYSRRWPRRGVRTGRRR